MSAIAWSPARRFRRGRLREQPLGPQLSGAILEVGEERSHLVQLRPQLFDAAQLTCDLSKRACWIGIQTPQAPLARLELTTHGQRPRLGLFLQRPQLALGRAGVHDLAESSDEGEIERFGHLGGGASFSDVGCDRRGGRRYLNRPASSRQYFEQR